MESPCSSHLDVAKCECVLCYLKDSVVKVLFLSTSSLIRLVGYANSDWADYPISR